jgi:hypothetical protein
MMRAGGCTLLPRLFGGVHLTASLWFFRSPKPASGVLSATRMNQRSRFNFQLFADGADCYPTPSVFTWWIAAELDIAEKLNLVRHEYDY